MTPVPFWSPEGLRAAVDGRWIRRPENPPPSGNARPIRIDGLSTDSRTIRPGQAFLSLRGEYFDGHDFVAIAADAGASLIIVDEHWPILPETATGDAWILQVNDTAAAILRAATVYRAAPDGLAPATVIAVAGSTGKTTTKNILSAILSRADKCTASPKSFNNSVGVPLTLLSADPDDRFVIVEIGTNAPGEIASLAAVAKPDVALIVSIGREHLEGLGSIDGVAREEAALLDHLAADGWSVVTADSPEFRSHYRGRQRITTFGFADDADCRIESVKVSADGTRFRTIEGHSGRSSEWCIPLTGRHNAANAAAAIAVATRLGITDADIASGLAAAQPADMRMNRATFNSIIIYNDAYNANPESMTAGIETFIAIVPPTARRIAILADMLELGAVSHACHAEIGRLVANHIAAGNLDSVVFIGPNMSTAAADAARSSFAASTLAPTPALGGDRLMCEPKSTDEAMRRVAGLLRPGDHVLLKGSRAMALERVVDQLRPSSPQAAPRQLPRAASTSHA